MLRVIQSEQERGPEAKIITVIGTGLLFVSIIVAVPGNCVLDMGYSIPLRVRALAFTFLLM